jgi:hypothetical protein
MGVDGATLWCRTVDALVAAPVILGTLVPVVRVHGPSPNEQPQTMAPRIAACRDGGHASAQDCHTHWAALRGGQRDVMRVAERA